MIRGISVIAIAAVGCGGSHAASHDAAVTDAPSTAIDAAVDASNGCPPVMAHVAAFCIDRYEGALEELGGDGLYHAASPYLVVGARTVRAVPAAGIVPQGYISGIEAAAACAASGKRLCTSTEWLGACQGAANQLYPYGDTLVAGACNVAYVGNPVVNYFGTSTGVFDDVHMNDPGINMQTGTVAAGGQFAACVTATGVFDLDGNLHEWIDDPAGTFRGGFYADAVLNGAGCTYSTTAHAATYHDYSTGFRCCADPTM